MNERLGKSPKREDLRSIVEKTANYEGDHTLLFMERLNDPSVKAKLVESLAREHIFRYYGANPEKGEAKIQEIRKKQEKILNERIEQVFKYTNLDLEERTNPGYGDINQPGWVCPYAEARQVGIDQEGPLSARQLNIVEAHEKGHGIRSFSKKSPVGIWICRSLDFSNITVSEEDIAIMRPLTNRKGLKPKTDKEIAQFHIQGLRDEPAEIVERMSQLKNYFGMKGDDKFTKEHLDYARKHYMEYLGWKLQIRLFFDAITPETESNFLDVINNLGV